MPPVVVGAAVAGVAAGIGAASIVTGIVIGALTLALGFITQALAPKPKLPNQASFEARARSNALSVRQPISPHKIVYGETRVGGTIVFIRTADFPGNADIKNEFLHLVIVFANHEVDSIGTIYFNDDLIFDDDLDSVGLVKSQSKFNINGRPKVRIIKHLGSSTQAADFDLVSEVPEWTDDHRLRGRAYLYIRLTWKQDLWPGGIPNISAIIKGKKVLDTRDSVTKWTPNPVLCIRDYLLATKITGGLGATTSEIDDTFVQSAANTCEQFVTTVNIIHTVTSVDISNETLSVNGERVFFSIGDRVQISTTDTLPGGLVAATNYYVIVHQHRPTNKLKLASSYANALLSTAINLTSIGSGTHSITKNAEPRYTLNGTIETDRTPKEILDEMLSSMAGRAVSVGGEWKFRAGAYVAPTITLDENDLRGGISVQTRDSHRDRFNAVKGIYASFWNDWQPQDYPPITNSTFETNDNNIRLWGELDLPFTNRPHTAMRLAKILLQRHRQEITLSMKCKLSAFQVEAGDNVNVDNDRMGWSGKPFEIHDFSFVVDEDDQDVPLLACDIVARETASTVYDWDSGEETVVDPEPNTNLPDPFDVDPPIIILASGEDELFVRLDGTVFSRIKVSWTTQDQFVLEGGVFEIQFKKSTDTVWNKAANVGGDETFTHILDVKDGVAYDVRVRAVNSIGIKSEFTVVTNHTVIGKEAPPPDVDILFLDGNIATWIYDNPPLDFAGFRLKSNANLNVFWANATQEHQGLLSDTRFDISRVGKKSRTAGRLTTILVKAVDTTGNESINPAILVKNLGDEIIENVLSTTDYEALGYPGTITNGSIDGSNDLIVDSAGSLFWDGVDTNPLWTGDHLTFWTDTFKTLTYDFSFIPEISFVGRNSTIRFSTLSIEGESFTHEIEAGDAFGAFWGNDDTAPFWSGTDTNLFWAGGLAFIPWPGNLTSITRQEYKFRITIAAGTTRGKITDLIIEIDVPNIIERLEDVSISSEGTRLSLTETFRQIDNIQITVQDDGGTAITARIIDKAKEGPLIKTMSDSSTFVAGTIDATLQGF